MNLEKTFRLKSPVILFLAIALLLAGYLPAQARDYLEITAAEARKLPFAVPYFIDQASPGTVRDLGKEMATLMSKGLEFHGFISIIPVDSYNGSQASDWVSLGAEFTVLGQYEITSSGIVLELRLTDIKEGQLILGRRYKGTLDKRKTMVLKFCDEVIEKLSGEPGISLSNVTFVSDKTGYKEIYIADVLGEEIRQVTKHNNLCVSPRFTLDGSQLTYSSYHRDNQNLYLADIAKNSTRAISWLEGLNMTPAWSPDGKYLVVTLSKDGNPDLYLASAQINNKEPIKILQRLTQDGGLNTSPSWSPDSERLAFVSDRSGAPQIYIMEVQSKKIDRLTFYGNYNTSPSWSPKGDMITYAGRHEGNYHIFTINSAGGPPTRLTQLWGDYESPSWSPDSRQIVFSRKRSKKQELCAMLANGAYQRPLFTQDGNQSSPFWGPRIKL